MEAARGHNLLYMTTFAYICNVLLILVMKGMYLLTLGVSCAIVSRIIFTDDH